QRFCAFFCMVFKEQELRAQIYQDAISFSTRARPKDGSGLYFLLILNFSDLCFSGRNQSTWTRPTFCRTSLFGIFIEISSKGCQFFQWKSRQWGKGSS